MKSKRLIIIAVMTGLALIMTMVISPAVKAFMAPAECAKLAQQVADSMKQEEAKLKAYQVANAKATSTPGEIAKAKVEWVDARQQSDKLRDKLAKECK